MSMRLGTQHVSRTRLGLSTAGARLILGALALLVGFPVACTRPTPPNAAGADAGGVDTRATDAGTSEGGGLDGRDRDAVIEAGGPTVLWPQRFGSSAHVHVVATDVSGNVFLVGELNGPIDFGGGRLEPTTSNADVFVASFDTNGKHRWSRRFAGSDGAYGRGLAVDGAGNVTIVGWFHGLVDFGGGPLTSAGFADVFIASFDTNGVYRWSKRFGGSGQDQATKVAADAQGNIVFTGGGSGPLDFGGGPLLGSGTFEAFVASFDALGRHRWSHVFGANVAADTGCAVAIDDAGRVFLAGTFGGEVNFGGGPLTGASYADLFLVSFGPTGDHRWSKAFGGPVSTSEVALAVAPTGDVVITAGSAAPLDFGGGPFPSADAPDIFVARFDALGSHRWSRRFGGESWDLPGGVALDKLSNVYLTGRFRKTIDFGGGALTSSGDDDVFVVALDPLGVHRWSKRFGGPGTDGGSSLVWDSAGHLFAAGGFMGAVDFGDGPGVPVPAGGIGIFVLRLVP